MFERRRRNVSFERRRRNVTNAPVGVAIVRKFERKERTQSFIGYERAYTVGVNCSTKEQKKKSEETHLHRRRKRKVQNK